MSSLLYGLWHPLILVIIGLSRQFAFAQFLAIPEARNFLEQHYPTIPIFGVYDPNQATDTESTKVRIAFSRQKDERDRAGKSEDDWKCDVVCFVCKTERYAFDAMHQERVSSIS